VVFELVVTKLPHYVLPTYPAIACLAAASLLSWETRDVGPWATRFMWAFAALWLVIGIALACWLPVATLVLESRGDAIGVLTAPAVVPLLGATLLLLRHNWPIRAVACASAAALVVFASAYAYQLPRLQTIWMSPRIADAVARARPCEGTTVATVPYAEPCLVFLLGTGTKLTDVRGATEHLLRDPTCALALVGRQERSQFLSLLTVADVEPREVDRIRGINYSNGKRLELTLYAASQDRARQAPIPQPRHLRRQAGRPHRRSVLRSHVGGP
jgi:4-amino-4-deoxy-L-arabinose transferase-like glycosyltransferase